MTPEQKNQLQALIDRRRNELLELVQHGQSSAEQHRRQSDDESACLDITINTAVEQQVLLGARREITKLTRMENWLDSDEAGLCLVCEAPIPYARLSAVLGTRLCVGCADTTEE